LYEASPVPASGKFRDDTALVFSHLYTPDDFVCVNTDFRLDKAGKPVIAGPGTTYRTRKWLRTACPTAERSRLGAAPDGSPLRHLKKAPAATSRMALREGISRQPESTHLLAEIHRVLRRWLIACPLFLPN
jgi:hypothetical protein